MFIVVTCNSRHAYLYVYYSYFDFYIYELLDLNHNQHNFIDENDGLINKEKEIMESFFKK